MRLFSRELVLHSPMYLGGVLVQFPAKKSHGKTPYGGARCGDPPRQEEEAGL